MTRHRQTWQVTMRGVRVLIRQPAFLGITLTQPLIWLLLFGALFKAVTLIPGFHGGSYLNFLTPGIVVMLAISSAGWTGMGFIEDINGGVMDRMLASPVWRGALNAGSVLYAVLTIVIQSVLLTLLALALGAHYKAASAACCC
ncbi:MAG TPA: ABC transporter permease [Solirubrobacteraceae bacterium]|nr:ABC transporter permease [Solirubrobacteraceae bacterium]